MTEQPPTVLIVDEETSTRDLLGKHMTELGLKCLMAEDGPTALDLVRREEPDLVLTNLLIRPMDGIELLKLIKTENPETAVIVFTGFSTEELIIEALRAGASDFVKKPFSMEVIQQVVQDALQRRTVMLRQGIDIQAVVFEEKRLEVSNEPKQISGVINQLTVCAPKYLDRERGHGLSVALYEVILNAVEHGNLEITHQEKYEQLNAGGYLDLINQRRAEPALSGRKVFIEYRLDEEGLHFTVRDQGQGFDWRGWRRLVKDTSDSLKAHGRGLLLAEFFADRLDFNEAGNEVSLFFKADRKGAAKCSRSS